MFQSVSGHSSKQSIVHYSSRPTVSPTLYPKTDLRITNLRRHKFPPSLTLLSFKTRIEWPPVLTATASFPSVFFQPLRYLRQRPRFSAHRAAQMTKTDLNFPAFSLKFVDFAVQFCFRCKFSFHEKRILSQVWQWRDFPGPITNSLLRIETNEIASFCIDNRLHQMAFFVFAKVGKGRLSSYVERFWNIQSFICSSLFLYYIKQIDSMLPCVCSVIDHRGRQNVVRTSVTHSAIASCATFLFLPHFDVICDLLLNRRTATWNLFVKKKHNFKPISARICFGLLSNSELIRGLTRARNLKKQCMYMQDIFLKTSFFWFI